ncbi:hypothetical protein [Streptomyces xanthii]|uniref:Uncharacterized protein n=1 Tax=Streptomyces xanthii TaxID=2768069 RepID=A0A7H1B796_9ACTN|nr:hypothetical protein [Streptomyces xanthii]QNS04601.1 hypothetical protein IAG42_13920 [Streptomyces xanthii]
MTQPPPPQDNNNPYGQQQPPQPGYGYPQQQPPAPGQPYAPFPQQQGGQPPMGFPPPPAGRSGNAGLAILVAVVVALVLAGIYGAIVKATEHEIGYAAVAVGAVVGFAAGKIGGRNQALPFVCAVIALAGVYLGQISGYAMMFADYANIGFFEALFDHFDLINEAWKSEADALTYVFMAVGAIAAFGSSKKAAL